MITLQISSTNSKGRTNLVSVKNSSAFLTQKVSFSKEQKSVKEQQQSLKIPSANPKAETPFDFWFSV